MSPLIVDPASEKALLNCLVYSGGALFDKLELDVELFFTPPHAQIFLACRSLFDLGAEINIMTLAHMLDTRGQLQDVGGHAMISELGSYATDAAHFHGLLHNALRRRKLGRILQSVDAAGEDVDSVLSALAAELSSIDPASKGEHVLPAMVDKVKSRFQRIREGKVVRGEETGIKAIDYHCGGLPDGFYCGLGARPGMGKSAMMEQIMANLLGRGVPVCCFAQDMAPDVLLERMACRLAGVSSWRLNKGLLEKWELNQVEQNLDDLAASPFRLHCVERMTGETMISVARREFRKHSVKHFFLDHIQTIYVPPRQERNETWAAASAGVRQFVNTMGVCWMTLAHLNREAAKERVAGHQIRGFDDLLGDVDGLFLLDTDINSADLSPGDDWAMRFVVDKNRNGPCGSPDIIFQRETMTFVPAK